MAKARSRRGRAAFAKVGVAVLVELGVHNPPAAALGANGESERVLAQRLVSAQPEKGLVISDRYYGLPALLVELPAQAERHFLVRVKTNLRRRMLASPGVPGSAWSLISGRPHAATSLVVPKTAEQPHDAPVMTGRTAL